MQITDSIADMLTRIRNANAAKHDTVKVPASNMKKAIAQILLDEGYIKGFKVEDDGKQGMIEIALKYGPNKSQVTEKLTSQATFSFKAPKRVLPSYQILRVFSLVSPLQRFDAQDDEVQSLTACSGTPFTQVTGTPAVIYLSSTHSTGK